MKCNYSICSLPGFHTRNSVLNFVYAIRHYELPISTWNYLYYITGTNEEKSKWRRNFYSNLKGIYFELVNIWLKCQKILDKVFKDNISSLLVPFQSGTEIPQTLSLRVFPPKAHCVKSVEFVQSWLIIGMNINYFHHKNTYCFKRSRNWYFFFWQILNWD